MSEWLTAKAREHKANRVAAGQGESRFCGVPLSELSREELEFAVEIAGENQRREMEQIGRDLDLITNMARRR